MNISKNIISRNIKSNKAYLKCNSDLPFKRQIIKQNNSLKSQEELTSQLIKKLFTNLNSHKELITDLKINYLAQCSDNSNNKGDNENCIIQISSYILFDIINSFESTISNSLEVIQSLKKEIGFYKDKLSKAKLHSRINPSTRNNIINNFNNQPLQINIPQNFTQDLTDKNIVSNLSNLNTSIAMNEVNEVRSTSKNSENNEINTNFDYLDSNLINNNSNSIQNTRPYRSSNRITDSASSNEQPQNYPKEFKFLTPTYETKLESKYRVKKYVSPTLNTRNNKYLYEFNTTNTRQNLKRNKNSIKKEHYNCNSNRNESSVSKLEHLKNIYDCMLSHTVEEEQNEEELEDEIDRTNYNSSTYLNYKTSQIFSGKNREYLSKEGNLHLKKPLRDKIKDNISIYNFNVRKNNVSNYISSKNNYI